MTTPELALAIFGREKLIQSYVVEKYFVSTVIRKCNALTEAQLWYYETIIFEWNNETKKRGKILECINAGDTPESAIMEHGNTCLRLFLNT